MKLGELSSFLDDVVPLSFQEDYDNSGLQVGLKDKEVSSALVTLDVTEQVIDEAVSKKYDLIVSHHPLIFNRIRNITDETYVERIIYKAIKHDIAIYSAHTNLDVLSNGVSRKMAEKLGLSSIRVLSPLKGKLLKLVTYVPESHIEGVREAVFNAGAGEIGNYDKCGFSLPGTGSFRAGEGTNPFVGKKNEIHYEDEIRFETVLYSHLKNQVVNALISEHPYEEVAYDMYPLVNDSNDEGLGCVGKLSEPMAEDKFLNHVSSVFNVKGLRFSKLIGKSIRTVAVCGGSGASLIKKAISSNADVYITADLKYHDFFDADGKIILIDTGHFENEKFSTEILYDLIVKKFPKFAVRFSATNTNPINYL